MFKPASTRPRGRLTVALALPVFISVTRTRKKRAPPAEVRTAALRWGLRTSDRALSNLAPSSAVILPSSIILRIFKRSSLVVMASTPRSADKNFNPLAIFALIHFHVERVVRRGGPIQGQDHLIDGSALKPGDFIPKQAEKPG